MKKIFLAAFLLFTACAPATAPAPQAVRVYVTSGASGRLADLYDCSTASTAIVLSDPQTADITLRLGPPDPLTSPAYQVGSEEVDVIVPSPSSLGPLTLDQVHSIFLGQAADWREVGGPELPIQVWTYAQAEDIQQIFEQNVMNDQPVTSLARLAVSAQDMLDSVARNAGAVGFLPRSWETSEVRAVYRVASEPVLAITAVQPQGASKDLIECLQK
ncbi:MAG TPA: substrate-binding domain-containing protein [Anaerolineales bacterium]|nr:substrate-binding domain-containing protein [Anaerolineales bacterium]